MTDFTSLFKVWQMSLIGVRIEYSSFRLSICKPNSGKYHPYRTAQQNTICCLLWYSVCRSCPSFLPPLCSLRKFSEQNHSSNFVRWLKVPVSVHYGDTTEYLPQENIAHTNLVIFSSHIPDIFNEPCSFHCSRFLQHKGIILYFGLFKLLSQF